MKKLDDMLEDFSVRKRLTRKDVEEWLALCDYARISHELKPPIIRNPLETNPLDSRKLYEMYLAVPRAGRAVHALLADFDLLWTVLEKTIAVYGQPGGPWNVPREPGQWITVATDALAHTARFAMESKHG